MYGSIQFLKLINLSGYVYPYFADADIKEVFVQTLAILSINICSFGNLPEAQVEFYIYRLSSSIPLSIKNI